MKEKEVDFSMQNPDNPGTTIALIGGSGKMGRWLAQFLKQENYNIVLADINQERLKAVADELGLRGSTNIGAVKEASIVILSVNIDSVEEVVREISPFIQPEHIVLDITSIKKKPVDLMHKHLNTNQVLGTHPVFGPGARDLANQNFVLTPTNQNEATLARKVQSFLEKRGARVSLMSPEQHDEMMAVVLGPAHFISIVAADTMATINKLPQMKAIGGSTYRVLTTLVESVISEDPELYATLQMHLPALVEIESLFQTNTAKWAALVKNQDKPGFKTNMIDLKRKFAENNSNFGQAYENMYKIMEWL